MGEKQEGSHTGNLIDKSQNEKEEIFDNIIGKYKNHPSIVNIKSNLPVDTDRTMLHFFEAQPSDIIKIIKELKSITSVGKHPTETCDYVSRSNCKPSYNINKCHSVGEFNLSKC